MPAWTDKLRGRARTAPQAGPGETSGVLDGYPAFSPAFPGHGPDFPLAHAQANLEQLLEALPRRLEVVTPVLARAGCDPRPALAGEDPRPLLAGLAAWVRGPAAALTQPWRDRPEGWRASRRDGPDLALSLFIDVGLVLGEVIRAFRPDYVWGVDDQRADRAMAYYRQPTLRVKAPRPGLTPTWLDFDVLGSVVHEAAGRGLGWDDPFTALVSGTVLGGHEQVWTAPGGVVAESPSWEAHLAEPRASRVRD